MTDTNRHGPHRTLARVVRAGTVALAFAVTVALLSGCFTMRRSEDGALEFVPFAEAQKQAEQSKKKADAAKKAEKAEDETDEAEHPDEADAASIGTPLTSGNWEVTVVSAKEKKKLPNGKKPKKGKTFLLVEVRIMNIGTDSDLNVRPKQFWMTDPTGKKVKPYDAELAAYNASSVRPIMIGMGTRTTFVYHVPKGSMDYVFTFKRRNTAKETLYWQVP